MVSAFLGKRETFSEGLKKKGFKEKLMETLSTAEAVSNTMGEADVPTKQSILIDCEPVLSGPTHCRLLKRCS